MPMLQKLTAGLLIALRNMETVEKKERNGGRVWKDGKNGRGK